MLQLIATIGLVYAGFCLLLFLAQEKLIFPAAAAGRGQPLPVASQVASEWLPLDDGSRVRVAFAPCAGASDWLLFFCGNGEDLRSGVLRAASLRGYGLNVVVPEYPGYGESEGAPGQAAIERMALAAARMVRARAGQGRVLVGGSSLGSFAAMRVAAEGLAARVLLVAPFTSVRAVAAQSFPWFPVAWLLRHPMDNLALAARVAVPALVVHGDRDQVIPLRYGEGLAKALGARLIVAHGCGHNDVPLEGSGPLGADLRAFLHGGD